MTLRLLLLSGERVGAAFSGSADLGSLTNYAPAIPHASSHENQRGHFLDPASRE
jgi:hypothetical protein